MPNALNMGLCEEQGIAGLAAAMEAEVSAQLFAQMAHQLAPAATACMRSGSDPGTAQLGFTALANNHYNNSSDNISDTIDGTITTNSKNSHNDPTQLFLGEYPLEVDARKTVAFQLPSTPFS